MMNRSYHAQHRTPVPPDMRPDGTPDITTLRTSRARQIANTTAEYITEPPRPVRPRSHSLRSRLGGLVLRITPFALAVIGLVVFWFRAVVPLWTNLQDQWHYGDNRVTHLDADVGHHGISHFAAEFYQGNIVIVELVPTHPNESQTYVLPGMYGATQSPVILLSVEDVNHDRKPDLLVQVDGTSLTFTLYNTGTGFSRKDG